jgi:DNA-binding FrmR family transcriptional regulator
VATSPAAPPSPPDQLVVRLKRAEGQLRGVQRMLDEGAECRQVLTQLSAVKAAIDQVGLQIIGERLRSCMADGGQDCVEQFDDAVATFLKFASLAK